MEVEKHSYYKNPQLDCDSFQHSGQSEYEPTGTQNFTVYSNTNTSEIDLLEKFNKQQYEQRKSFSQQQEQQTNRGQQRKNQQQQINIGQPRENQLQDLLQQVQGQATLKELKQQLQSFEQPELTQQIQIQHQPQRLIQYRDMQRQQLQRERDYSQNQIYTQKQSMRVQSISANSTYVAASYNDVRDVQQQQQQQHTSQERELSEDQNMEYSRNNLIMQQPQQIQQMQQQSTLKIFPQMQQEVPVQKQQRLMRHKSIEKNCVQDPTDYNQSNAGTYFRNVRPDKILAESLQYIDPHEAMNSNSQGHHVTWVGGELGQEVQVTSRSDAISLKNVVSNAIQSMESYTEIASTNENIQYANPANIIYSSSGTELSSSPAHSATSQESGRSIRHLEVSSSNVIPLDLYQNKDTMRLDARQLMMSYEQSLTSSQQTVTKYPNDVTSSHQLNTSLPCLTSYPTAGNTSQQFVPSPHQYMTPFQENVISPNTVMESTHAAGSDLKNISSSSHIIISPQQTMTPVQQSVTSPQQSMASPQLLMASSQQTMLSSHQSMMPLQQSMTPQYQTMTSSYQVMTSPQQCMTSPQQSMISPQKSMTLSQHSMASPQQSIPLQRQTVTLPHQAMTSSQQYLTSQNYMTSPQDIVTSQFQGMTPRHQCMTPHQQGMMSHRQSITSSSVPGYYNNSASQSVIHPPSRLDLLSGKRKRPDSPTESAVSQDYYETDIRCFVPLKSEHHPPDLAYGLADDGIYCCGIGMDGSLRPECTSLSSGSGAQILFNPYNQSEWINLVNDYGAVMSGPAFKVTADKGFNFSHFDDSFVCQKKNHFQITTHTFFPHLPKYVKTTEGGLLPIHNFFLDFQGIKMEQPEHNIKVDQSHPDRSKHPYQPVQISLQPNVVSKVTVGRLHFSETTINNMRKKGRPNPDQKYFQLIVQLCAKTSYGNYVVSAQLSDRIIVRASNPGQFEGDPDTLWSKGRPADSVFHLGNVGVNTDAPEEALTVHGNIRCTGHVTNPSDKRAKHSIEEKDTSEQLRNISQLKVYTYTYKDEFAEYAGLSEDSRMDTGVLAQEVAQIIPEAVEQTGDVMLPSGEVIDNFLVVNKDRIYIENVGAVKELCKLTNNLEYRVNEIEDLNRKLRITKRLPLKRSLSWKSSFSSSEISNSGLDEGTPNRTKSARSETVEALDLAEIKPPSYSKMPPNQNHHDKYQHHQHRHKHHHRNSKHRNGKNSGERTLAHDSRISKESVEDMGRGDVEERTGGFCCGNRALQIAVIVLVVVMAICLVTLTTLIVLEETKVSDLATPRPTTPSYSTDAPSNTSNETTASSLNYGMSTDSSLQIPGVELYVPELNSIIVPTSSACSNDTSQCDVIIVLPAKYIYNITLNDQSSPPSQLTLQFIGSQENVLYCSSMLGSDCGSNSSAIDSNSIDSTAKQLNASNPGVSEWLIPIYTDITSTYQFQSDKSQLCQIEPTDESIRTYIVNILWNCS